MTDAKYHEGRAARTWVIWCSAVLTVVIAVLGFSWWWLPQWKPLLVIEYSPWPDPALRALRYDSTRWASSLVGERLWSYGPAVGPALLRQFAVGDHEHRLRVIEFGKEMARSDGVAAGTVAPQSLRVRFHEDELNHLKENLYLLVREALADGATDLINEASYLSVSLRDLRLVPAFGDVLASQKSSTAKDLDPVVRMLGSLRDARAVPSLISLLPFRDHANTVVEDALDQCLDAGSLSQVIAATKHSHEVVRTWAARQFARYEKSTDLAKRLIALLGDDKQQVRVAAVKGLSAGNYQAACPRFMELAKNEKDLPVRIAAVEALGEMEYQLAAPCLRSLVTTAPDLVRNEAIIALGDLADAASFSILFPLLQNEDKTVAIKAHWSLSQLPLTSDQQKAVDAIWPIEPLK